MANNNPPLPGYPVVDPTDTSRPDVALSPALLGRAGVPVMALLGDSHMRLQYNDFTFPGVLQGVTRLAPIYMANFMVGNRVQIKYNFGVTGDRVDMIRSRMGASLLPLIRKGQVQYVALDGDANDVAQIGGTDSTGATISAVSVLAHIKATVLELLNAGARGVFLQTGYPRSIPGGPAATSMTASQIAAHVAINNGKRQLAQAIPGVYLVDVFGCLLDYSSTTNMSKCMPLAALMDTEGLHLGNHQACYQVALKWAEVFKTVLPKVPYAPGLSHYDGTNGDSKNFWKAMAGTSGALGTGFTGTVLTNCRPLRMAGDTTTTGVASVITRQQMCTELGIDYDGVPANVQKVTITAGASDALVQIDNNWNTALLPAVGLGKTVVLGGEVAAKITSGGASDTVQAIALNANLQVRNEYVFGDSTTSKMTSCKQLYMVLQTQPVPISLTESGKMNPYFLYQINAGAVADIYLSNPYMYVEA
jgi:hypothetical protein